MKRALIMVFVVALVAAAGLVGYIVSSNDDSSTTATAASDGSDAATESVRLDTAIVARRDFVETTEIEGTLGFGSPSALPNRAAGVLTWLPEPGSIIEYGDVLYEIDNQPVVYLPGELPAYRAMDTRTEGDDVHQLEKWLFDRGFMEPLNATVDGDYTTYTAQAVEDWYEATYDLTDVDTIGNGMVVFGIGPFRVSSVSGILGAPVNGGSILSTTDSTRLVSVQLDPALSGILAVSQTVVVELPDDTEAEATVSFVADVVTTEGQGNQAVSWIDVELVLEGTGTGFDESPVTIFVEEAIERDATVVPISALLALAEGGHAIEVMRDGVPTLVGVQIGSFLGNEASVVGDVNPGDEVVVP